MATLRAELTANGNGVGQLGCSISDGVPNAISVFFNPAASDVMMEAAIKDILDKLERGAELLQTGAIPVTVLPSFSQSFSRRFLSPSAPPPQQQPLASHSPPLLPPMPHSSSIGPGQLVSSGGSLTNVLVGISPPTSPPCQDSDFPSAPPMPRSSSIGLGQLVSS
eukprot:scaffold145563_cov115-Phaeocystis_antarctica.AAC.1